MKMNHILLSAMLLATATTALAGDDPITRGFNVVMDKAVHGHIQVIVLDDEKPCAALIQIAAMSVQRNKPVPGCVKLTTANMDSPEATKMLEMFDSYNLMVIGAKNPN